MDFVKETKKIPKLTEIKLPEIKLNLKLPNLPDVKWNLNWILILFFILFGIFFLYNCKYGMFKAIDIEPYAFNI